MTDFVLSSGNTIRPHRSPWGAFPIKGMKLSTGISSAVIRVGQTVVLDTGSTSYADSIIPCAQSSGSLNPAANSIVGIAAETPGAAGGNVGSGTTNTVGTVITVWEANPNAEFKAWTKYGLLNSTIVGTPKELHRDSTLNIDLVALRASSLGTPANCVIVTSLIDASGDSGGAVTFRFNTSSGFLAFYR